MHKIRYQKHLMLELRKMGWLVDLKVWGRKKRKGGRGVL